MSNHSIINLLDEQQSIISGLRKACSHIVGIAEKYLLNFRNSLIQDDDSLEQLNYSKQENSFLAVFFKVSNLLLKLIPLEQQLYGTRMIKDLEKIKEQNIEDLSISDEDLELLEKFLSEERKNNNKNKNF